MRRPATENHPILTHEPDLRGYKVTGEKKCDVQPIRLNRIGAYKNQSVRGDLGTDSHLRSRFFFIRRRPAQLEGSGAALIMSPVIATLRYP